jgi:hypothetical protein
MRVKYPPRKLDRYWIKGKIMSKGGSTTSTSSIDPQIKDAFLSNFEQAKNVAGALPVQQFAGYNPLQLAGEEALVNTSLAGPGIAGTDLAAQMASTNSLYQPNQITAQQTNLGMSGPGSIASYMNPYTESVRKNALADLESSRQMAVQQTGERAAAAKAFGGSRQAVAESLTNAGFAKQSGDLGTRLNEQAFNQAMALQQADIGRMSAADIANQQAGLQGAQLRLSGTGQLGSLAAQQQALRLGGAQNVMAAGSARQAQEQQRMDAIRNIGLQRLGVVQSSLGAQPANLGMVATTPYTQNVGAGALGGALAGSQLAGTLGLSGGAGAGLGALLSLI